MAQWAGLGYYARARNLLKCARKVVADHGGVFPQTRVALLKLPGIGPYTAAAIGAIAFDLPEVVVDGNVERVMARMFNIHTPLPAAKRALTAQAATLTPTRRPGDYAQAVMDLGATICTPRSPSCDLCPWRESCRAWAAGTAELLPLKSPKTPKPTRYGIAYVARRADGAWLLERRPDKGLLGGMLGWPGTVWGDHPEPAPPFIAEWQDCKTELRHTFTHFNLRLKVFTAQVPIGRIIADAEFLPEAQFSPQALPTVMRKIHALACVTLRPD